MDFHPSDHQQAIIASAAQFGAQHLAKLRASKDMPRETWKLWGREGWLGLCVPSALGGGGHDALTAVLAYESLGRAGAARGQLFAAGAHLFGCSMAIVNHGTAEQQALWSPLLASGEAIGALAFTEPEGGSNLASCATLLNVENGGFRLNGCKTYVSNAAVADVFVVLATTSAAPPPFNLSVMLLPRDTAGLRITPITSAVGLGQSQPAEIVMTDCRVPASALLGKSGGGMGILLSIMRWERSCILAGLLGALERDLVAVTRYLDQRDAGNAPASRHQAVAHALASVRTKLEATRWLMYRAAWEVDHGQEPLIFAAMSKLAVSETMVNCALELQKLVAGLGWTDGLGLAEALSDVIGTLSASGTNNVQLNTIASQLDRG